MTYILALILIFFALPFIGRLILRGLQWWMARKVARMQRNAFEQMFGQAAGQRQRQAEPVYNEPPRPHRRREKRIDPSVGEYVEYEELEGSGYASQGAPATETFTAESQVDDAEWEEVK